MIKMDYRNRQISVKFTATEYEQLVNKSKSSTCRTLSEYFRKIITNKPIITTYRNKSLDELMIEMIQLKKELTVIGDNFNHAVKKLHTLHQIPEFKDWIEIYETERNLLMSKVEEIKIVTAKIGEQWLQ